MLAPWKKSYYQPRQHVKKQRHTLLTKVCLVKAMVFSSRHVQMWELDHKEGWALENWCFWTVVLEKTLESPMDFKEIQPVNPKENQPWIFIGRNDAVVEIQYFGHLIWRPDSLEKTLILGNIEGRRRWGWHRIRWLDGITDWMDMSLGELRELLMAWSSAVHRVTKESDMTGRLNWTDYPGSCTFRMKYWKKVKERSWTSKCFRRKPWI